MLTLVSASIELLLRLAAVSSRPQKYHPASGAFKTANSRRPARPRAAFRLEADDVVPRRDLKRSWRLSAIKTDNDDAG